MFERNGQGVLTSNIKPKPASGARSSWKRGGACLMAMVAVALFACGPASAAAEDLGELQASDAGVAPPEATACRVAIEEVLWNHRTWPAENPGPKPVFDHAAAAVALEPRVEDALRQSTALATLYGQPSRARCSRPSSTAWRRRAASPRCCVTSSPCWATTRRCSPSVWRVPCWRNVCSATSTGTMLASPTILSLSAPGGRPSAPSTRQTLGTPEHGYSLPEIVGLSPPPHISDGNFTPEGVDVWSDTPSIPDAQLSTAVWTGTEMIVWGGLNNGSGGKRTTAGATTRRPTPGAISHINAPEERAQHTAVWTGSEMIVWGGCNRFNISFCVVNNGGRYDPRQRYLDADQHDRRARRARRPHGGVDGQRDDRLGRMLAPSIATTPVRGGRYDPATNTLDGGRRHTARPPHAAITRRCGPAAR